MNTTKVKVIRGHGYWGHGRWEVVDRKNPDNAIERQLFIHRDEARLFARIRNRSESFSAAVREFAGM